MPSNLDSRGVMIYTSRQVFNSGGFTKRSRASGKWYVFSNTGLPMFVLVKKVTLLPRLGMRAAQDKIIPQLMDDLNNIF